MTVWHRLVSVVRRLLHRDRAERDMADELETFVDMAAADGMRDGASPDDARRAALIHLGGMEQAKERVRSARRGVWLDEMGRDLRYGLLQVRRNPGFSTVAILTLALGVGVNTAMFSAVDAVLIRPLPFADADRLVMVWDDMTPSDGESKFFTTPPEWRAWRRLNTVFTDIAATQPGDAVLSNLGDPEDLPARKVTGNFWRVLGARPQLGRVFTEQEDVQGARVVVISHGFWQRRFGAAPGVVGRTISLNDTPYEVIGVMPREFYFMPARDVDVWMPASMSPAMLNNLGWHDLHTVARLKPGVSLEQARTEMAALSQRLTIQATNRARSATVTPLREDLTGKTSTSLLVLLAAAGAVLLIACVNLANLLLARGVTRGREVAVRAAMGASRGRLIRQFLSESVLLAGLGALAGLALALPAMRFLETLVPPTMGAVQLTLDWRVLGVSAAIALAAGVAFGLVPALRGSRPDVQESLRDGGRGSAGARSYRFQHSLIVAETALAVVLLTIGGLLLQTFQHLNQLDLGIQRERVLTLVTPLFRYPDFEKRVAFVNAQLEKIRALPGVVSAGAISRVPLTVSDQSTFYLLDGQARSNDTATQVALTRVVTRDYFATVGARLREGRFFDIADRRSDEPVAIVNETFADRHFPGRSALGQRFKFGRLGPQGYSYTIVGVVKEIRDRGVAEELQPAIYRVHEQGDQTGDVPSGIVVRTTIDPASMVPAIRQAIWSIDRNQPVARVQTIDEIVSRQLAVPTQNTVLLGAFALLALLLASVGLYGVLAYAVTQRASEIGVRMALGASSHDILLAFSGRGLALTLVGLVIGVGVAVLSARAMTALFFDFRPDYASAVVLAAAVFLAVAFVASMIPAFRASRIPPTIALQQE
jgi:predicted permease